MFNSSLECPARSGTALQHLALYRLADPDPGFIGTVVGIALALSDAGSVENYQDPTLLKQLTQSLGVAFFTTLLALLQSAVADVCAARGAGDGGVVAEPDRAVLPGIT